jgi:quercetin dioxygenase-like cupin family protein
MVSLTSPEEEAYCVIRGTIPSGVSVPLHSHDDAESFYVLSGEAQVLMQAETGLEWMTLQRGYFAQIPAGTKHAWRNLSSDLFEVIVITTPRLGRFLRGLGELVRDEGRDGHSLEMLQRCVEMSGCYGYWFGSPEENAAVGIEL